MLYFHSSDCFDLFHIRLNLNAKL